MCARYTLRRAINDLTLRTNFTVITTFDREDLMCDVHGIMFMYVICPLTELTFGIMSAKLSMPYFIGRLRSALILCSSLTGRMFHGYPFY